MTEEGIPRRLGLSPVASIPCPDPKKLSCPLAQPPINRLNAEPGGKTVVTSRMGWPGGLPWEQSHVFPSCFSLFSLW